MQVKDWKEWHQDRTWWNHIYSGAFEVAIVGNPQFSVERNKLHARLITKAPEMLNYLKLIAETGIVNKQSIQNLISEIEGVSNDK